MRPHVPLAVATSVGGDEKGITSKRTLAGTTSEKSLELPQHPTSPVANCAHAVPRKVQMRRAGSRADSSVWKLLAVALTMPPSAVTELGPFTSRPGDNGRVGGHAMLPRPSCAQRRSRPPRKPRTGKPTAQRSGNANEEPPSRSSRLARLLPQHRVSPDNESAHTLNECTPTSVYVQRVSASTLRRVAHSPSMQRNESRHVASAHAVPSVIGVSIQPTAGSQLADRQPDVTGQDRGLVTHCPLAPHASLVHGLPSSQLPAFCARHTPPTHRPDAPQPGSQPVPSTRAVVTHVPSSVENVAVVHAPASHTGIGSASAINSTCVVVMPSSSVSVPVFGPAASGANVTGTSSAAPPASSRLASTENGAVTASVLDTGARPPFVS